MVMKMNNKKLYEWEDLVLPLVEKHFKDKEVKTLLIDFIVDRTDNFSFFLSREEFFNLGDCEAIKQYMKLHLEKAKTVSLLRIITFTD